MKNLKKSKENKELRDQELNKAAGGIKLPDEWEPDDWEPDDWVAHVECPKCKRTYTLTCCGDRGCPYCGIFGR